MGRDARTRPRGRETTRWDARLRPAQVVVGDNQEKRARWLLRFVMRDLEHLSREEMEEVSWQVSAFIDSVPGATRYTRYPAAEAETRRCQGWLADGLGRLRRGQPWRFKVERPSTYVLDLQPRRFVPIAPPDHGFRSFTDAFMAESATVLAKRLAFCPAAGCGKPFIVYRRRMYCNKRCADRERIRRFRARNPDYSGKRYREKQQRSIYPRVRVQPRGGLSGAC
jgi:hypothetical protein